MGPTLLLTASLLLADQHVRAPLYRSRAQRLASLVWFTLLAVFMSVLTGAFAAVVVLAVAAVQWWRWSRHAELLGASWGPSAQADRLVALWRGDEARSEVPQVIEGVELPVGRALQCEGEAPPAREWVVPPDAGGD